MKNKKDEADVRSYLVKIYGVVQGVGFRPFVYRKAKEFKILGWVENAGGAVIIDCSGTKANLKHFLTEIVKNPPALSKIERVRCISKAYTFAEGFVIKESIQDRKQVRFISPDVAVCPKCLEDVRRSGTSRYRYAFTNCTECGPRYSIIKALPYDRISTTMQTFSMCSTCDDEYHNPLSRRFHAQPNCCDKCGPELFLTDNKGNRIRCQDAIKETIKLLKDGKILAIKGVGGFHLVCDARNEVAIKTLRNRKLRKHKPFALMARDMEAVKEICYASEKEEELLTSNKRPIVIMKKIEFSALTDVIAPAQKSLGVMLPYAPLHYLLFDEELRLLIMTSANISGMPIEYRNEEAIAHLHKVADYFLMNNRDIYVPIDDSVVKVIEEREAIIRRARGYVPYSVRADTERQIVALGAEQKNTVCISKNGYINMSQYLGDLEQLSCYENFQYVLKHLVKLFDVNAEIIVHDMHPGYLSTQYAKAQKVETLEIQHHHAHMVSCMAEHLLYEPVIGVVFDGTGFGLDKAVWGGEFLVGTRKSFVRAGHLEYISIQGGEKAVREPWRCAASYLYALGYDSVKVIKGVEREKLEGVKQALKAGLNYFLSSSIGRLFDAVAVLIGLRNNITYDGQAAIELEGIIEEDIDELYCCQIKDNDGSLCVEYEWIIRGVVQDAERGESPSRISAKFHNTLALAASSMVCLLRIKYGINKVVLSGGVFENQYLLKKLHKSLLENDFEVFYNQQIPINDGGISFGQLHAASAMMEDRYVSCSTS